MKRIGILTAGGDTPALNATIQGAVLRACQRKVEVFGFIKGFSSLFNPRVPHVHLNPLFTPIPELDLEELEIFREQTSTTLSWRLNSQTFTTRNLHLFLPIVTRPITLLSTLLPNLFRIFYSSVTLKTMLHLLKACATQGLQKEYSNTMMFETWRSNSLKLLQMLSN